MAALFGGKKDKSSERSVKTLSEVEIRKKLYGEFSSKSRTPAGADQPLPPLPRPEKETKPWTVRSAVALKSPASTVDAEEEKDLFLTSREDRPGSNGSSDQSKAEGSPAGAAIRKPAVDFSKRDVEEPLFNRPKKQISKDAGRDKPKANPWARKAAEVLFAGLKVLGTWTARFIFAVLQLLDPRKPLTRTLFYVLAGLAIIVALFWGVHSLNVQRQEAMSPYDSKTFESAMTEAVAVAEQQKEPASETAAEEQPVAESPIVSVESEALEAPLMISGDAVPASTPVMPLGRYVIQIATYAYQQDAERIRNLLAGEGFSAFYEKISRTGGKFFYSVFLGRYEDYRSAQNFLEEFRRNEVSRPFHDAFIRTLEA